MEVSEGAVTIEAPEQPDAGVGEAVFFNPRMELNRDVTVAALRAYRDRTSGPEPATYLDATAATGIRGVRAAADGWDVTLVDPDEEAAKYCRRNLDRNNLDGSVLERDANVVLHESRGSRTRFDVVDVDPFGSPVPFLDAAVRNSAGLLCVTATDTAPLCGAHFDSGRRRYAAVPRTTEYHAEMGVRVLLSAIARTAAKHDIAIGPLLTHASDHYVRTYLDITRGASAANRSIEALGFVHHCPECYARDHERGLVAHPPSECWACGAERVMTAGPLWLASVHDRAFAGSVRTRIDDGFGTASRGRRLLDRIKAELDTPTHFDQHRLAERWGEPAAPMDEFLEALRSAGFDASRTHYGGTTFKTDATVGEIRRARPAVE